MDATEIILVIGGCRSGKSSHAVELGEQRRTRKHIFIATCVARDDELAERIKNHRDERGRHWHTVETPVALPEAVARHAGPQTVVLIDCLTLWITNLLMKMPLPDMDLVTEQVQALCVALEKAKGTVILVSNEVGTGIVPENKLARFFRDAAGYVNQTVAAAATSVIWVVAGIPVEIKKPEEHQTKRDDASL